MKYQDEMLNRMKRPDMKTAEDRIFESEELLKSLGYSLDNVPQIMPDAERKTIVIPTWEKLYAEAEKDVGTEVELESLFTDEEIKANKQAILMLNEEYNAVHRLDKFDVKVNRNEHKKNGEHFIHATEYVCKCGAYGRVKQFNFFHKIMPPYKSADSSRLYPHLCNVLP